VVGFAIDVVGLDWEGGRGGGQGGHVECLFVRMYVECSGWDFTPAPVTVLYSPSYHLMIRAALGPWRYAKCY